MKDFITVFMFYLRKHLRSKGFAIITTLMCVLAVIMMFACNQFLSDDKKNTVYIVNHIKEFNDIWKNDIYNEEIGNMKLDFSMLDNEESEDKLVEEAKSKKISIIVFENENGQPTMNLIDKGKISYTDINLLQSITKQIVQSKNAIESGMSLETLKAINTEIGIKNTDINEERNIAIPFILFLFMIMFIILYSNAAVNEVAYLKTNRVMEIFSTSTKPLPLFLGVNIASALIPIIQVSVTAICIWIANNFISIDFDKITASIGIKLSGVEFSTILLYMILLLLGYFVYSFIATSMVSIVNKIEDVNNIAVPIAMIGLVQYFIGIIALEQDSIILKVFSYIPLTSSSITFLRYECGYAGISEVVLSIGILTICVCILAYFGAKLFTRGVSYYGTLKEFKSGLSSKNK